MSANTNPETGIRYGIIAANSLDPEVVNDIQMNGRDVHYEEAKAELTKLIVDACDEFMGSAGRSDVAEYAVERMELYYDEPVHEFDIECEGYGRVKGRTTWLGGALMVWIFESPFTGAFALCSPCVPNCCDLDAAGGYEGYDVPADWRNQRDL